MQFGQQALPANRPQMFPLPPVNLSLAMTLVRQEMRTMKVSKVVLITNNEEEVCQYEASSIGHVSDHVGYSSIIKSGVRRGLASLARADCKRRLA
jgi:hypothetical protein